MLDLSNSIRFVTLGPDGTNHSLMVLEYAKYRGLRGVETLFVSDFSDALAMVKQGQADYLLICGVHPQCSRVVAEGSFQYGIHLMDVFISPSQPLGVLSQKDLTHPKSLALHPATAGYADVSAWQDHVHVNSIMEVAEGLLQGDYDSGITATRFAHEHPDRLRIDQVIGSPDDPWLVLGNNRVSNGGIIACKEAPIVEFMSADRKTK